MTGERREKKREEEEEVSQVVVVYPLFFGHVEAGVVPFLFSVFCSGMHAYTHIYIRTFSYQGVLFAS